jgi:hypothetical protein
VQQHAWHNKQPQVDVGQGVRLLEVHFATLPTQVGVVHKVKRLVHKVVTIPLLQLQVLVRVGYVQVQS